MFERQVTCLIPGRSMETYHGHVRSPADAIVLFEACRIGLLPRVQRRLSEKERASITSGSVFVWDEREAGMRRWTDGKSWSASRVSGSFLTYREMEGRRSNGTPISGNAGGAKKDKDGDSEAPEGYRYKPDGLMKQSFSISTSSGQHLHLISYYSRIGAAAHGLPTPSQDPRLRHIRPEKGMYPESQLGPEHNVGPAIIQGPMGSPVYNAAAHASPMQSAAPTSPYRRPAPYHQYPPYGGGPLPPGYIPPSPLHTPAQSPYPNPAANSPHHQLQYPPRTQRGNAPLTAFDRPPAPLTNNAVPAGPGPAAPGPYYSASSQSRQQLQYGGYPPPPERHTEPRQLPSLNMPTLPDRRPDSVLRVSSEDKAGSAAGGRSVIPSLSSLLNGVPPTEQVVSQRQSAPRLPDLAAKTGLLNPDTRALRDLDKLTFRV